MILVFWERSFTLLVNLLDRLIIPVKLGDAGIGKFCGYGGYGGAGRHYDDAFHGRTNAMRVSINWDRKRRARV